MPRPISLLPNVPQAPASKSMFRSLAIASSGLTAQRVRMETIATNLANAETTRGANGQPYQRRVVRMEPANVAGAAGVAGGDPSMTAPGQIPFTVPPFGTAAFDVPARGDAPQSFAVDFGEPARGVRVAGIDEDRSEGPLVYDPGHPDADAKGYVRYPNVSVTNEMVDLMDARRVFEANATVFQSAKAMLKRALEI